MQRRELFPVSTPMTTNETSTNLVPVQVSLTGYVVHPRWSGEVSSANAILIVLCRQQWDCGQTCVPRAPELSSSPEDLSDGATALQYQC